jgi:hypothetical protein
VPKDVIISYERFRECREKRQEIAAERARKAGERTIEGEVLAVSPASTIASASVLAPPLAPAPGDPVVHPQPPRVEKEHAPKG